jgi:hypothetical protein
MCTVRFLNAHRTHSWYAGNVVSVMVSVRSENDSLAYIVVEVRGELNKDGIIPAVGTLRKALIKCSDERDINCAHFVAYQRPSRYSGSTLVDWCMLKLMRKRVQERSARMVVE